MIVPRDRLIVWTGAVLFAVAVFAAVGAVGGTAAAVVLGGLIAVCLFDAAVSLSRLEGVHAALPGVIRLTKDRDGRFYVEVRADQGADQRRALSLGIAFPEHIVSPREEVHTELRGAAPVLIEWPCTATARGNFVIENVYLETGSLFGLWSIRKVAATRAEVRAYPNTLQDQKNLASIFLNRGMFGVHAHRQIGKGREFEQLREYMPGDNYEDIHWKATAKRGRPVTKVFQIERTQEVYVVIDASRLSARRVVPEIRGRFPIFDASTLPTASQLGAENREASPYFPYFRETSQLERFITAAMVLGLVAEKQGDLFGVVAFDDRIRAFVRARNGKAHYSACRDALYALEPRLVNPDFAEICSTIRVRLRRRALLIFLTNLDDPVLAENFLHHVGVIASRHLVFANMINLPGIAPLFAQPDVTVADDVYQRLGGHLQWRKLREMERVLKHRGVTMALLDNERMCPQLVEQYINVKRRQIL